MIGVIADDLTGAAEIGAVGLRHGLRAEIVRPGGVPGKSDLVCMDTDSRSCPPEEAGLRAATAARALAEAGAEWIYKKVDSVLRGQVTAEIEAVMRELRCQRALLLPANPSLGRTIREGRYYVNGRLIHKTEFARDPEYPRRWSRVLQLLKVPDDFAIQVVNGDHALPARTIVVGEAGSSEDVRSWVQAVPPDVLRTGGSEFFHALLEQHVPGRPSVARSAPAELPAVGRELFVCGTSTRSSRAFIARARRRKQPVVTLPQELVWGADFTAPAQAAITQRALAAFAHHPRVIVAVGLPVVRNAEVARRLSRHVVEIAGQVLAAQPVDRIFAEGGATAAELVRAMGWERLTVERELAPGVATLAVGAEQSTLLTIKPGTYVWPEQWT
jgi:uncharacterized protein YgbK (DUF1537 family)